MLSLRESFFDNGYVNWHNMISTGQFQFLQSFLFSGFILSEDFKSSIDFHEILFNFIFRFLERIGELKLSDFQTENHFHASIIILIFLTIDDIHAQSIIFYFKPWTLDEHILIQLSFLINSLKADYSCFL